MTGHYQYMPRASLKEQLIEGAAPVLHARGFNGCSVQDLVSAAGVPKGSFYNHFASKEELAVEVVTRYANGYDIDSLLVGESAPLVRLREKLSSIAATIELDVARGCMLGNFSTEMSPHSELLRERVEAIFQHWADVNATVLREAQQAGDLAAGADVDALGWYLVGAFEGSIASAKLARDRAPIDAFLDVTFDTLLPARA
jgi:TetR/AcrR family transcriptional regulator, transcriptional repressor for nem operon